MTARTEDLPAVGIPIELYLMAGLLLGALAIKARYLLDVLHAAGRPAALTYTEGVNGILATRPELWYQPLAQPPHFPMIYPPLYHIIVGGLSALTGANVFIVMHGVALASGVAGGIALYGIARNLGGSPTAGLIAFAGYWLSPIVTGATVLGRVDHLGIAFGLLAVYSATKRGRGDPFSAGAIIVLSMFVKHSLIVFPIAIVAWYWWRGHRRDALAFVAFTATVGLGLLGVLVLLTDGRAWTHLVVINRSQQWFWRNAFNLSGWLLLIHASMFVGIAACVIRRRRLAAAEVAIVLSLVISTAMAGKAGAWSGYFLPVAAAAALAWGLDAGKVFDDRPSIAWLLVGLLLVGQAGQYAAMQPSPDLERDAQAQVQALVDAADGPVLTVDNGLLVDGERAEPYEPQLLKPATNGVVPGRARLVDRLEAGEFALIVLRTDPRGPSAETRWTGAQLDAVAEHYHLVGTYGEYRVYQPRDN